MTSAFERGSAVTPVGEGRFVAEIPDGWQQGRGAFGGLVLAALLRAMEACEPDRARATRWLTGELCGPVLPGPAEIAVEVLRRGHNVTNLDARLRQGGEVLARASAVLGAPRRVTTASVDPTPPRVPDWREVPALEMAAPRGPVFAGHVEFRPTGPLPVVPGPLAETGGFTRMREPPARLDAPALVALLDTWWPALFSVTGIRPMATVGFTAQLLGDPAELPAADPLFHVGRVAGPVQGGFFAETRELWSGDRRVALNHQTFAVLG
jgi:hypothetical protein